MAKRRRKIKIIRLTSGSFKLLPIACLCLISLMIVSAQVAGALHYSPDSATRDSEPEPEPEQEQRSELKSSHLPIYSAAASSSATSQQSQQQQQEQQSAAQQAGDSVSGHEQTISDSGGEQPEEAGNSEEQPPRQSVGQLCNQLPHHSARHLKLCKLIGQSPDADEPVALGAARGLAECRAQFKAERWNCTHQQASRPSGEQAAGQSHDHALLTSELAQSVGNRESGYLHAIAAAGIVHSIATACSMGSLKECACDKTRVGLYRHHEDKWKWGGCSHNIRHGMLFAKHLVELLDAVHQHRSYLAAAGSGRQLHWQSRHGRGHQQHAAHQGRALGKRSLSSRHREPNQLRGGLVQQQSAAEAQAPTSAKSSLLVAAESPQQQGASSQQQQQFCSKNQSNISQAAHLNLIKSLLSANSLERHQEFRLAMNMHNNKIGRMAVAKKMVLRCRCHGLSGSCSMETCWLTLPNIQVIGSYLKRKYEASVHLPSAVDVNKLIPMMDRNEISAILSGSQLQQAQQPQTRTADASIATLGTTKAASDELATGQGVGLEPPVPQNRISGHFITTSPANQTATSGAHFSYYERHKQLAQLTPEPQPTTTTTQSALEIPVDNIAPMSQQQYQSLLRDMKLCNTTTTSTYPMASRQEQSSGDFSNNNNNLMGSAHQTLGKRHANRKLQHSATGSGLDKLNQLSGQQQQVATGQQLKNANHQLSQLLQSNKDELIHLHKSPDYCEPDARHGFGGIRSRVCSDNPSAPDNCDKLCCGRGYSTQSYKHTYSCNCGFRYCCFVHCSVCEKEIKLQICN